MITSLSPNQTSRMIKLITDLSVRTEKEPIIPLASGKLSNYYIDLRAAMMDSFCSTCIGMGMLQLMDDELEWPDFLGGVATAGIPVVQSMLINMDMDAIPLELRSSGLIIRTEAKLHGTGGLISGLPVGQTLTGKTVIVVEDTITSGGSVLKAVKAVRDAGGVPVAVLAVVDRGTNTAETFKAEGLEFFSLFKAKDFYPEGFIPRVIDPPTA